MISSTGALVAYSGLRTGRSPKDKRVVLDETTKDEVWWGNVNIPIKPDVYNLLEDIAVNYLNSRKKIFIVDGYAGYDVNHRMKFRILTTRAYHAIFMRNMLIMPSQ